MKIIIGGSPGTGKTVVAKLLVKKIKYKLIDVNKFAEENKLITGYDKKRRCEIIDTDGLAKEISKLKGTLVIDGHLAHFCKADIVFVLRCDIKELKKRLLKKKWNSEKIKENTEAEIFGVISEEAKDINKNVFEIDTTEKKALDTTKIIIKILKNKE